MFSICFTIANVRPTRRSRDSEEKEDAGKGVEERANAPEESRELQEEEEEDLVGLKKVEKEEGGSGMESLLHCDSQSSGIFSQVDKLPQTVKLYPFALRRVLTGLSARPDSPGMVRLSRAGERRGGGVAGEERVRRRRREEEEGRPRIGEK